MDRQTDKIVAVVCVIQKLVTQCSSGTPDGRVKVGQCLHDSNRMAEGCYQDGAIALFYGGGGDASWWGWIQSAKEKVVTQSSEVLEFVKKDIDEFTKVVSEEASSMVSSTATTLKEKLRLDEDDSTANSMKKSVSGFLNHVAEVFTPPPDDGDQEAIVIRNQQPVILNRLQAAIYAVSQDAATYLTDPEGEEAQYETWLSTFDLESCQTELSDLLVNNQPLRHHYTTLVPAQVSHVVFWHRYFYKVNQLEAAEEKRKILKERADKTSTDPDLVWDEESNEDEWEKVDATDASAQSPPTSSSATKTIKEEKPEEQKNEDWESWD
ncbi:BSD domain-containing protein 1-like isoform X4 [Scylla paramamosain]|uniref:BSD domain-containing protein 1-like isoform X4 n=1 Tax=Scylla paramamosain TaxID=85552 RepID=UPI003082B1B8